MNLQGWTWSNNDLCLTVLSLRASEAPAARRHQGEGSRDCGSGNTNRADSPTAQPGLDFSSGNEEVLMGLGSIPNSESRTQKELISAIGGG